MAERLNMMFAIDPTLIHCLLRQILITDPRLSLTNVECRQHSSTSVSTEFMGILNGLYGTNQYSIVPAYDKNTLVGFKVDKLEPTNLISVNTNQDLTIE